MSSTGLKDGKKKKIAQNPDKELASIWISAACVFSLWTGGCNVL
jgi:hypothetical protein